MTRKELDALTPEQKCVRIAELGGGPGWHRPTEQEIASGSYYQYCPDYLKDLNAIHSVVQFAIYQQCPTLAAMYRLRLAEIVHPRNDIPLACKVWLVWLAVDATADQRADALLLTVG